MDFRLFDEKFRHNKLKYFAQVSMGGIAVGLALLLFDVVNQPAIIASFGSSAFVAFAMPKQKISRPRYLIGGYFIGALVGSLIHLLTIIPIDHQIAQKLIYVVGGAIAVGLAMFLMAITNTEHPPATGIALGLVLNEWMPWTILLVMIGITVISLVQRSMKRWMIDLI